MDSRKRTMSVLPGGEDDPKWVMRNAKLRTSRTMLFAGGLLPVLFCRLCEKDEIPGFLAQQYAATPVDRVAWAFSQMGLIDEGLRCLGAYDEWISMLQDDETRKAIGALARTLAMLRRYSSASAPSDLDFNVPARVAIRERSGSRVTPVPGLLRAEAVADQLDLTECSKARHPTLSWASRRVRVLVSSRRLVACHQHARWRSEAVVAYS